MLKIAGLLLAIGAAFWGQGAPAQTFEVASVKPADPDSPGTMIGFPNNSAFHATGITAMNCITVAYSILPFQLTGGPGWIYAQHYDITAKLPAGASGNEGVRLALQALMAERFQLAVHRETRTMPAYVLAVAKNGFKLKEAADSPNKGSMSMGRGKMTAQGMSIESLVRTLAGNLGSPVVDMTGIKGVFDLTLEWAPDEGAAAEPSAGPSIFTALQEQLGLKLEKQKAPVEMIVIDRIEKPSAN